jgi:hypothetical protein
MTLSNHLAERHTIPARWKNFGGFNGVVLCKWQKA